MDTSSWEESMYGFGSSFGSGLLLSIFILKTTKKTCYWFFDPHGLTHVSHRFNRLFIFWTPISHHMAFPPLSLPSSRNPFLSHFFYTSQVIRLDCIAHETSPSIWIFFLFETMLVYVFWVCHFSGDFSKPPLNSNCPLLLAYHITQSQINQSTMVLLLPGSLPFLLFTLSISTLTLKSPWSSLSATTSPQPSPPAVVSPTILAS